MRSTNLSIQSVLVLALSVIVILFGIAAFPWQASAAETISIGTGQIVPLAPIGQGTCVQPQILTFHTYVYDGALHTFDFSLQDSSYVAIIGSVGNTSIPFNQMNRQIDSAGVLHIQVNVETTAVGTGLPVSVTMLSAKGSGQPVCETKIKTTVMPVGDASVATENVTSNSQAPQSTISFVARKPSNTGATQTGSFIIGSIATSTTATSTPALGSAQSVLKNACSNGGAGRLWFFLLVLYALVVAAAVLVETHQPQEWRSVAIVVPLILLAGLWLLAPNCHTSVLVPAIAIGIALIAFFFAKQENVAGVIELPAARN